MWNHVWGLWWWADTLSRGELPWQTALLSHPHGGVLWFADPLGALAALPLTLTLGPAVAWNGLLVARIAWAGFHARRLAAALGEPGAHTVVAGLAFATSPYLLCELGNGISEVCATGWIPLVLTRWLLAARSGSLRDWLVAGLALGVTTWATPYYGVALALVLAPATLLRLGRAWAAWRPALVGVLVAGLVGGGAVATWRTAITTKGAVIQREEGSERALARHNAVDLREPFWPGEFRSVDLEAEYGGEQFRHTVYLRWSVLLCAVVAAVRRPRAVLPWLGLAAWSLVLGLGQRPFYAGRELFGPGGPLLPFGWLAAMVPGMAITHPARLAVAAHAILAAVAADALRGLDRRAIAVGLVMVGEGLGFSLAVWPIPAADAHIPVLYREIARSDDPRGVLDLPAQVRRTMATSVYFWYQTAHRRPVPWWPNVRAQNGDGRLVGAFGPTPGLGAGRSRSRSLGEEEVEALRDRYGWVVVHPAFEAGTPTAGESTRQLTAAFGPPAEADGLRVWRIPERER